MKYEIVRKFEDARRLFPHTVNRTYLNSASQGPFCLPVKEAIEENIAMRVAAERDDGWIAHEAAEFLRTNLAKMIGARKSEVGIGLSTSFGINLAAFGLPLKSGDEILVSDIEFPASVYVWRAAAEKRGLKLKFVKSTSLFFDIDALEKAITSRSRVLSISYVQFFNGYKNDLATLSEICKKHGLYFVVDGIQGMGVEPINVRKLGIDIFSSGCQKWMLSPQGCGFFYLSERAQAELTAPFMSWLGVDWKMQYTDLFRYDLPYFESARRYEMGYYAVLNLCGMKAAVDLIMELGIKNIQSHNRELLDQLARYVRASSSFSITSSMDTKHRSSVLTFTTKRLKELHQEILNSKITLVRREGSIRVSAHLFNDETDIDRLIAVMEKFAR